TEFDSETLVAPLLPRPATIHAIDAGLRRICD
ncbi:MAG: hypothetical protein ACI90M_001083, partial [Candidatus Azotimanducaceae bacterium]